MQTTFSTFAQLEHELPAKTLFQAQSSTYLSEKKLLLFTLQMNDIYWKRRTMTVAFQRMFGILERWNNNQVTPSLSKPHELSYRSNSYKIDRCDLIPVTPSFVNSTKLICTPNIYSFILHIVQPFIEWISNLFIFHNSKTISSNKIHYFFFFIIYRKKSNVHNWIFFCFFLNRNNSNSRTRNKCGNKFLFTFGNKNNSTQIINVKKKSFWI